ncbi:MAG: M36 family metallopeptidase [Saprospiraceae bacterium]|nr:M36 family metallopeptidase [Saprospiraceae bacterium]
MRINLILLFIVSLYFTSPLNAQSDAKLQKALSSFYETSPNSGLTESDLNELIISDRYKDSHNGVEHFYFQQSYKGIPIYNAISSVHIGSEGQIYNSPSRFIGSLDSKINTVNPKIDALKALETCIRHYHIQNAILPKHSNRSSNDKNYFAKTNFTQSDIPYKLIYVSQGDVLRLAWDLTLELVQSSDYWNVRVDAVTGKVIDQNNFTVYCKFPHQRTHSNCEEHQHDNSELLNTDKTSATKLLSAPSYNILPLPAESPIHGNRSLVLNPADPIASKFGWHTTKSDGSAEFTTTRGNNVYAYLDADSDNNPDPTVQVDGGSGLVFDFPFDQTKNPESYRPAAITNLFYMCNMIHDISYKFGFTEVAGNFQVNTYGKGGLGDRVNAEAQDGSGVDNANFSTPADGSNGRMQMYLWNSTSDIVVTEPAIVAGGLLSIKGSFGGASPTTPIIAQAVYSNDGSTDPKKGCKNSQSSNLRGKIAFIERGICEFGDKALFAQNAGALAVVIYGFDNQGVNMAAGARGGEVTIPAYYIKVSVFNSIKKQLDEGSLILKIEKPSSNDNKPELLDGDFDNGIIAHEYGHGISNRLTGGPAQAGCLGNAENMGEGWSDFFSLITTAKNGDKGSDVRGIGNYATSNPVSSNGIRRRPYSTDLNVNEFTYKDLTSSTHDVGEVWAAMLWDLYWALSDKYGYDPDFNNKNAGNNIAIQLVMDGMKLQPCSPGFVDGRDAILKADQLNNNGVNQCLIWDVFARRGVGFKAKQGSSGTTGDEVEDFNSYPTCINSTLVSKTADPLVKAGNEINYEIMISNMRASKINNIVITDNIPTGCTYINGSASIIPSSINSNSLEWNITSMDSLEIRSIKYRVKTDPNTFSNTVFIDQLNDDKAQDDWTIEINRGSSFWYYFNDQGVGQSPAFQSSTESATASDVSLTSKNEIDLGQENVALLFFHKYLTQKNVDGGFVQISSDNGNSFDLIDPSEWAINGYDGNISYNAISIPRNKGFTGYVPNFIPAVLNLNKYKGKKIKLTFRFGNDDQPLSTTLTDHQGWTIDDIEIINPKYYNAEVCVSTSLNEKICKSVKGEGTLIDSKKILAVENQTKIGGITYYPNPAKKRMNIIFENNIEYDKIEFYSLSGQLLKAIPVTQNHMNISLSDLASGMVIVKVIGAQMTNSFKLILE